MKGCYDLKINVTNSLKKKKKVSFYLVSAHSSVLGAVCGFQKCTLQANI